MESLRQEIEQSLKSVFAHLDIPESPWLKMLSESRERAQGDYSLPCFPIAKALGQNPIELAQSIAEKIDSSVEAKAVNGYLNFKSTPEWLFGHIFSSSSAKIDHQVLIEHTSANPNGPFHVGRARTAILGDTLVRLHRLHGHDVRAEYYVDDMGKQVAALAWGLENLSQDEVEQILGDVEPIPEIWSQKSDHLRVRCYQAVQRLRANKDERAAQIEQEIGSMVHASEEGDEEVLHRFEQAYQPVLDGMLETLARLGVHFDAFTKESRFVVDGTVERLMDDMSSLPIHGEADNGAHFLDLGQRGLKGKTDFFYRRGDGSSLYATRDVAYHLWKFGQCEHLINVLGEDHRLQAKQVGLTLQEFGQTPPDIVFYAFIKLPEGKMSTRKGNVVFMDDLLEEAQSQAYVVVKELRPELDEVNLQKIAEAVGVSAVRFNIIRVSPEKGFTFKWEDALSFEGNSAPFIMYSHTRACSIAKKVSEKPSLSNLPPQPENAAIDLMRTLAWFDERLSRSVQESKPQLFAGYLLELASAYNGFYRDCSVMRDGNVDAFHFHLSEKARMNLKSGMEALGIVALEEM